MTGALPNAFILGVPKAGTSSLARSLGDHPDVFVPETKEPNFHLLRNGPLNATGPASPKVIQFMLHRFSVGDLGSYRALFAPGAERRVRLDGSVRYLYHPDALESVVDSYPDAHHIVVLRDPAERAVSHWRMNRRYHLEPLSFAEAVAAEEERIAAGWGWDWHYRRVGAYAPQLRRLFAKVPRSQVLIILYGDFVRDPEATVAACFDHLGVAPRPVGLSHRVMAPTEPRWAALDRLLEHPTKIRRVVRSLPGGPNLAGRLRSWNSRRPSPVDDVAMRRLRSDHEEDLVEVAALLGIEIDALRNGLSAQGPVRYGEAPR